MNLLRRAVDDLLQGKSNVFCLSGEAGIGKSRLIEELKLSPPPETVQWLEGHAYSHTQSIPYFPLINLLGRAFQIKEDEPQQVIRNKIESQLCKIVSDGLDLAPYIGRLFHLNFGGIENLDPEFWKAELKHIILRVLSALSSKAPTIIVIEDLHWVDPSFSDLLHFILSHLNFPTLFLLTGRPPLNFFGDLPSIPAERRLQTINLQALSPTESRKILSSMLDGSDLPPELNHYLLKTAGGNPFYLEEITNCLVESNFLLQSNNAWKLTRPLDELNAPPTIQGVISARIDQLDDDAKKILQWGSVFGRVFSPEILDKILEPELHVDEILNRLSQMDLVHRRSGQTDSEYVFKHALIQEIVYNSLLKRRRSAIHAKIAFAMEKYYGQNLAKHCETLAYHFYAGGCAAEALQYQLQSAAKCLHKYSVSEADQFYRSSYEILKKQIKNSEKENGLLIDLINKWSMVLYYLGDFRFCEQLLARHKHMAESFGDREKLGQFYIWLGHSLLMREKVKEAHEHLLRALEIGEKINDPAIIGLACTWLVYTSGDMGLLDKGLACGLRARKISDTLQDDYLVYSAYSALSRIYWFRGESRRVLETAEAMLDFGHKNSNLRCLVAGYIGMGQGYSSAGDFPAAVRSFERAVELAADPLYAQWPKIHLALGYIQNDEYFKAENVLQELLSFSERNGYEAAGTAAYGLLGIVMIAKGKLSQGFEILTKAHQSIQRNGYMPYKNANVHLLMGKIFSQICQRKGSGGRMLRSASNILFLLKNIPVAGRKAAKHFDQALAIASKMEAKGILGQIYLEKGLLDIARKEKASAKKNIRQSIAMFRQCEATVFFNKAIGILNAL